MQRKTVSVAVDEALTLWYAVRQDEAMRAQFSVEPSEDEAREIAGWRDLQRSAAARLFQSD